MNVALAVCAAGSAIDRFSNRLSIFNVIEQIVSPSFPVWVPEMTFAVVLRRGEQDPQRFQASARVHMGNEIINTAQVGIDFENGQFARQIMNFQGLPVIHPGELVFELLLPNGAVASSSIPVTLVAPSAPAAAPAPNPGS